MFKLKRYSKNPILAPIKNHNWESKMVFNCAAVLKDDKVHLLYRARGENEVGGILISYIGHAILKKDGTTLEKRYEYPVFGPKEEYERAGCEDPRITFIDGKYYMLYTAYFGKTAPKEYEKEKYNIAMASTKDFVNWERHGIILPEVKTPEKNGVLFSRKINGNYVIYYRVEPDIYVAYSKTLEKPEWFGHKIVASPRAGFWDAWKIGAGAPPIETDKGWLFIYHGIDQMGTKGVKTGYGTVDYQRTYRLGVMLIDKNDPEKILYRSNGWILEPEEKYEMEGMVPRVVFSCGSVIIGDELFVYYGGADTVIGVANCKISELMKAIENNII